MPNVSRSWCMQFFLCPLEDFSGTRICSLQEESKCATVKMVSDRKTWRSLVVGGFTSSERYFMHQVPKLEKSTKQETFI